MPGKKAALLRQGTANARGDEQKSSQAVPVGQARNTGRSPLPIIGRGRILGTCVRKGMCLPREISHIALERRMRGKVAVVSRNRHWIVWEKSAKGIVVLGNEP